MINDRSIADCRQWDCRKTIRSARNDRMNPALMKLSQLYLLEPPRWPYPDDRTGR